MRRPVCLHKEKRKMHTAAHLPPILYKRGVSFSHLLNSSPSHLLMYFFPFCITMPFASLLTRWPARL